MVCLSINNCGSSKTKVGKSLKGKKRNNCSLRESRRRKSSVDQARRGISDMVDNVSLDKPKSKEIIHNEKEEKKHSSNEDRLHHKWINVPTVLKDSELMLFEQYEKKLTHSVKGEEDDINTSDKFTTNPEIKAKEVKKVSIKKDPHIEKLPTKANGPKEKFNSLKKLFSSKNMKESSKKTAPIQKVVTKKVEKKSAKVSKPKHIKGGTLPLISDIKSLMKSDSEPTVKSKLVQGIEKENIIPVKTVPQAKSAYIPSKKKEDKQPEKAPLDDKKPIKKSNTLQEEERYINLVQLSPDFSMSSNQDFEEALLDKTQLSKSQKSLRTEDKIEHDSFKETLHEDEKYESLAEIQNTRL
uniref:Uncharacterized protein n=1 Tax=Parastrongyloides trichosuri TaxID=131310 RepID=A0A0N4ZNP8_PARTI